MSQRKRKAIRKWMLINIQDFVNWKKIYRQLKRSYNKKELKIIKKL